MLRKLTAQQEKLLPVVRDYWLEKMFGGFKEIDREKATKGIEWLYTFSKLEKPRKVVFMSSPLGAELAANIIGRDQVVNQVVNQVRDQVWRQVENQVWDQVGNQFGNQVRNQVWDQVGNQVGNQVINQVRDQVWRQVWRQVENQVWDQVGNQFGNQVRNQVWDQVGNQVEKAGLKFFSFADYGSVADYSWVSFYVFFEQIGVLKDHEGFRKFKELLESNIYDIILLDKVCIVCEIPQYIRRDSQNRLHSEKESAIRWSDTYELFFLWGVSFDKALWERVVSKTITAKEVLSLENTEQRMAALKVIGVEEILKNAELLDVSQRGNSLYKVSGIFPQDEYFLKYECLSTGRIYVKCVELQTLNGKPHADSCQAWSFSISLEEYCNLEWEA